MRRLIAMADVAIPNRFELELLTESRTESVPELVAAARRLVAAGPALVVVTGVRAGAEMGALAVTGDSARFAAAPYVEVPASGAGDVFAAIFLARWRSEEHTSELQSLMRISYAVSCLKKTT